MEGEKNEKEIVHIQSNNRYLDCRELYLFLGNDYIVKYNNIVKFLIVFYILTLEGTLESSILYLIFIFFNKF